MSDEINEMEDEKSKFEQYYDMAISQLQELIENFELEYEKNQNPEMLVYSEDIKKCIEEIKQTVEEEELTDEKKKVFADYVEELIERYSNYYLTVLAVEALQELAEKSPQEFEKMPKWEDIVNNEALQYDPLNNMENVQNEKFNEEDLNNPEMIALYNQILVALTNTNTTTDDKKKEENTNKNESEKE